jgi:hypothetical protein
MDHGRQPALTADCAGGRGVKQAIENGKCPHLPAERLAGSCGSELAQFRAMVGS